ncbi:MAG: hypothetical protein A2X84_03500 [Desulfuromonadaceae bacterium GWC2_58_13]|nr:MAG: hypothetical protein A2X84_03500 [Desulfuromonadaceae bacterium GWC2_58_13]
MFQKSRYVAQILLTALLLFPLISFANVPPPPAEQTLGLLDAVFNDLNEQQCRECHGPSVSDLHHTLASDEKLDCMSCHSLQSVDGSFRLVFTTNCLDCHEQQPGESSVHHLSATAQAGDCVACHDSLVQNRDDGHYIPSYAATMVTPLPSNGAGPDGRGSCQFCHDGGTDETTGELIFSNMQTHHETGFDQCAWCHNAQSATALAIRPCEQCHAPLSIHNIQVDTNGDGIITPGGEAAYFGHIGSNDDCLGCHGGFTETTTITGTRGRINNPTRHHLLIRTKDKKCLDCHTLVLNEDDLFVFEDFRVCRNCHGGHRQ